MNSIGGQLRSLVRGSELRRQSTYTVARFVGAAMAQFVTVVLIARALGPQGNGHYAMVVLIPTFMANCLNLGIGPASVYHVGRGEVGVRQVTAVSIWMAIVLAAMGSGAAALLVLVYGEVLFPGVDRALLVMGIAAFPMALLSAYLRAVLQACEEFARLNWVALVPPCATMLCVAFVLYGLESGIQGAVGGFVTGQVAGAIVAGAMVLRTISVKAGLEQGGPVTGYWKAALAYGWKAHLSNVLAFVNYRADIFLVNFFLNPFATGIYVVAVQVAEKIWILSRAVSAVLLPRLSAMNDDTGRRFRLARRVAWRVTLATSVAASIAAIAMIYLLTSVFGDQYMDAYLPFLILLPRIIVGSGSRVLASCIAAAGRPEWNMYVSAVVVSLNIAGNSILIPAFGMAGAAAATSFAYAVNGAFKMYTVRKTTKNGIASAVHRTCRVRNTFEISREGGVVRE